MYTQPEEISREIKEGRLQDVSSHNDAVRHSFIPRGVTKTGTEIRLWIDEDAPEDREFDEFDRFCVGGDTEIFASETDVRGALRALYSTYLVAIPDYLNEER